MANGAMSIFDRNDQDVIKLLLKDIKNGGLFYYSSSIIASIQKLKMGDISLEEKQLHMVGFLFELMYDVSIVTEHNVSESPVFECFLVDYHK